MHLGHALRPSEQVSLVRAIPSGLRTVRACVAWHLVLQVPYTQLRPDLSALARVCEPPVPTHGYTQLGIRVALLSLALSDLLAHWDASNAGTALQSLAPVAQSVWALQRRIPDAHGGADVARSAVKDGVQRLGLRLWYQAKYYVERQHDRGLLLPLLEGLAPHRGVA